MPERQQSIAGHTMRWKFDDGPTAGTTYEHTFRSDGTVTYKQLESGSSGGKKSEDGAPDKKTAAKKDPAKYASFEVADGMHLVSYRSEMGWTLTVHVNVKTESLHGFASNDKEWYPITGKVVA